MNSMPVLKRTMSNDFDKLKDIFEMAEVLTNEGHDTLEILTVDETANKTLTVIFSFNKERELIEVYAEE
jgi:hypothetical protein